MAFTRDGHRINGTSNDELEPTTKVRCGGPLVCQVCSRDAWQLLSLVEATREKDAFALIRKTLHNLGLDEDKIQTFLRKTRNIEFAMRTTEK